ncbi:hypothetical protein D3C78_1191140 [compost metagenome]
MIFAVPAGSAADALTRRWHNASLAATKPRAANACGSLATRLSTPELSSTWRCCAGEKKPGSGTQGTPPNSAARSQNSHSGPLSRAIARRCTAPRCRIACRAATSSSNWA